MKKRDLANRLIVSLEQKRNTSNPDLMIVPDLDVDWSNKHPGEYNGEVADGRPHGFGILDAADGTYYEGQWENGKKTGLGKLETNQGYYIGHWENDQQSGTGCLIEYEGNYYEGEWKDGKRNGMGTQYWAEGDSYCGEWHKNARKGEGKHKCADGSSFFGVWSCDLPYTGELTNKHNVTIRVSEFMVDHQPINFFICGNEAIRDQLEHGGYFDAFPVIAYAFSNLELGSFAIRSVSDFRYTWIYEYERSDRPYLLVYVEETFYKIREDYYLDPDIEPVYNKQIWKLEEFDASELIGLLRESNEDVDFIISGLKEYSFILWEGMGDLSAWLFDSSLYDPEEDYFGQRKVSVDHPQDDEIRIHYEFDRRVVSLEYWTRVIWFEPGLVEEPKPNAWDLERINETELLYEKELNRIRTFFIKNRKESTIAIDDQDLLDLFPGTYKGAVHPENVALGYGKYSDEHGNFYEGGFVAGVRHGIGKLSYTRTDIIGETRVTYIGWWNNGKYSGAGILWEGKDVYTGEFIHGYRNETGTQRWANGDVYRGDWLRGYRLGHGDYITNYGLEIEAIWSGDLPLEGTMKRKGFSNVEFEQFSVSGKPYVYIPCYGIYNDTMNGTYWDMRVADIDSIVFTDFTMGVIRLMSKAPMVLKRDVKSWPPKVMFGTRDDHIEMINSVFVNAHKPKWSVKNGSWGKIEKKELMEYHANSIRSDDRRLRYALSKLEMGIWKNAEDYCVWPFPVDAYKNLDPASYETHSLFINDPIGGHIRIDYVTEHWGRKKLRITQIEYEKEKYHALMLGDEDEVELEEGDWNYEF